jgi:hypothetical protein
MASLTGSTIAASYEQLLSLPDGGLNGNTLVAITDGDSSTAIGMKVATSKIEVIPASDDANAFEVSNAAGTAILTINSSTPSVLVAGSGTKLYFNDAGGEYISGDGTDLTITSGTDILLAAGGNIGIGITTMSAPAGADPKVQIEGTDADNSSLSIWRNTAGASGPYFTIGHSRGGAVNSVDKLVDNDILGTIQWSGGDDSDRSPVGANIFARIDGTPASNDMPAELVFGTTPDGGSAAPTERLTIHADGDITTAGNIVIDADDKGLVLGADQDVTLYSNYAGSLLLGRGTDVTASAADTEGWMELNVGDSGTSSITLAGGEGGDAVINFFADGGDDNSDKWKIRGIDGDFHLSSFSTGSYVDVISTNAGGHTVMNRQAAFLVHPASSQDDIAADASEVNVLFGTEVFDQGGNFASSTFTAPATGKYQLNLLLRLNAIDVAANYYLITVKTSNNNIYAIYDPENGGTDVNYGCYTVAVLADMDTNDTAIVTINQNGGTQQVDIHADSYFSGFLAC